MSRSSGGYTTSVDLKRCGVTKGVHAVRVTDEALARPERTGGNVVEKAVNAAVNYVDRWRTAFDYMRDMLEMTPLDDMERLLLCLPKICDAEAGRAGNELNAQGMLYLGDMLRKWFASPGSVSAYENTPFWVEFVWATGFLRAQREYVKFIDPDYDRTIGGSIFNGNAKKKLGEILQKDGKLQDVPTSFDYIGSPWETWKDYYHSERTIHRTVVVDGLMAALAACSIRVLAKGTVKPLSNKKWRITVQKMAVFVHDVFNFDEEDGFLGGEVGFWDCKKLAGPLSLVDGVHVTNADFAAWRETHGRGGDFLVLSLPQKVENFFGAPYEYPQ